LKVVISDEPNFRPFTYERERLGALGIDVVVADVGETALAQQAAEAEVVFNLGDVISRPTLECLRCCQMIAFYGIGVDAIDVVAATEMGILVTNCPSFGTEEVADHALALLLACARPLLGFDRAMREGCWEWGPFRPLHSLNRQSIGIIGFGRIGRAMARRLRPLGCRIMFSDPYVHDAPIEGVAGVSLEELLHTADYVTIHAPLTPDTSGLLSEARLRLMKPTAYVINTGRGAIIDEHALARALTERRIAGAALDVFVCEPLPANHPLLGAPNVILSPHIAGYTEEAFQRIRQTACDAVERLRRGEWPEHVVNPTLRPRARLTSRMESRE
jgi:D-3-phosphoglycerate dehydrogenase